MSTPYFLHESATGYSLFEGSGLDEIGLSASAVQQSVLNIERFGKVVKLTAFQPFKSAAEALGEINSVSEGLLTEELRQFLEMSLPKVKLNLQVRTLRSPRYMRATFFITYSPTVPTLKILRFLHWRGICSWSFLKAKGMEKHTQADDKVLCCR